MDVREELVHCILEANREGAMEIIHEWSMENPLEEVVESVLVPVLAKLSLLWDELIEPPLAPAYVTSRVIRDIMQLVQKNRPKEVCQEQLGPIVVCNIENDFHSLGREVLVSFLEANGWKVIDFGNDITAKDLIDKAIEVNAKVVGVSAMMLTTAQTIKTVREEIDKRGLNIKLAVGGAIFNLRDSLIQEVGGDGTCKTALGAHSLFKSLWAEAEEGDRHE